MADFQDTGISKRMFGPLSFEESNLEKYDSARKQDCILCNKNFCLKNQQTEFLKHIFEEHNLVIEDFQSIVRFDKYVQFWKDKFKQKPMESTIPSLQIENTNKFYFLLSQLSKEDKEIRHKLKLESALDQQEHERLTLNFKRSCLFCKLQFEGKIIDCIKHLSEQHNLQLGKPENLVYVAEFLDVIEEKIDSLKCIYCEKTFTDRNVLKEHMRKKLHKRINPANRFYDKFYIVNYLEPDRNWQHLQKEDDTLPITIDEDSDLDWSDWNEKEEEIVCLFCENRNNSLSNLCDHMKQSHNFDYFTIINSLDYYQRVKLVNYIRRQIHMNRCINCDTKFETKEEMLDHLENKKHFTCPDLKIFNRPEYYFPTYENDTLLYYLEEINDAEEL